MHCGFSSSFASLHSVHSLSLSFPRLCLLCWLFLACWASFFAIGSRYWFLGLFSGGFDRVLGVFRVSVAPLVGTPPPDDTWYTFLSGLAPSGFPQEDMWRVSPIRTSSGEAHDTRKHHIRTTVISHPDDRHSLSGYVCSNHLLK